MYILTSAGGQTTDVPLPAKFAAEADLRVADELLLYEREARVTGSSDLRVVVRVCSRQRHVVSVVDLGAGCGHTTK